MVAVRNTARFTTVLMSAGALVLGVGATPALAATHVVTPGPNAIQKAVDRARPGDVLLVRPGTYRESVFINKTLSLRGAGATGAGTVIVPPATTTSLCATPDEMPGICVLGEVDENFNLLKRVNDVRISGVFVRGFSGDGIIAFGTRDYQVTRSRAAENHGYGIAGFDGKRSFFAYNRVLDNTGPGLYMGDSRDAGNRIVGNESRRNEYGIFMRDSTGMTAENNLVSHNCIGIFPLDTGSPNAAGRYTIRNNSVFYNSKACPAGGPAPAFSGLGIALGGVHDTLVSGNTLVGNKPTGESIASGGIVLFSTKGFGGADPRNNEVHANSIFGSAPADIVWDGTGTGNHLGGNRCGRSLPRGLC